MRTDEHKRHFLCVLAMVCFTSSSSVWADDSPRDIVKSAIKAHGGEEKIAATLTGSLSAKAKLSLPPAAEATVSWEEIFELPRRYKRAIKGKLNEQNLSMEYAVTGGSGWIRQNGGAVQEFKGQQLPLNRSWNAMLVNLLPLLEEKVKLAPGGTEKVGGRDAIGVSVSSDQEKYTLYFDSKSGLLVKSKRRMQHPLSGKEVDGEGLFGDYKEVAGVQYPQRISTYIEGKKVIELEITRIELLKKVEDQVFAKP